MAVPVNGSEHADAVLADRIAGSSLRDIGLRYGLADDDVRRLLNSAGHFDLSRLREGDEATEADEDRLARQRRWRQRRVLAVRWITGVTVASALLAFLDYRSDQQAVDAREVARAERAAAVEANERLRLGAACTASALGRGAEAATAVFSCLSGEDSDLVVYLAGCTEGLVDGQSMPTAGDVDLAWFECLLDAQPYDDGF